MTDIGFELRVVARLLPQRQRERFALLLLTTSLEDGFRLACLFCAAQLLFGQATLLFFGASLLLATLLFGDPVAFERSQVT